VVVMLRITHKGQRCNLLATVTVASFNFNYCRNLNVLNCFIRMTVRHAQMSSSGHVLVCLRYTSKSANIKKGDIA